MLPLLLVAAFIAPQLFVARESGALIDVLIREGILTNQEAENIRAELVRENNVIPANVSGGGKSTDRLSLGMRMQMQYANLTSDTRGESSNPASTNRFFLRRMYLTMKAGVGGNWGATMTYDLASGGYDDALRRLVCWCELVSPRQRPEVSARRGLRSDEGLAYRRTRGGQHRWSSFPNAGSILNQP
jgi:hypothetical protein